MDASKSRTSFTMLEESGFNEILLFLRVIKNPTHANAFDFGSSWFQSQHLPCECACLVSKLLQSSKSSCRARQSYRELEDHPDFILLGATCSQPCLAFRHTKEHVT